MLSCRDRRWYRRDNTDNSTTPTPTSPITPTSIPSIIIPLPFWNNTDGGLPSFLPPFFPFGPGNNTPRPFPHPPRIPRRGGFRHHPGGQRPGNEEQDQSEQYQQPTQQQQQSPQSQPSTQQRELIPLTRSDARLYDSLSQLRGDEPWFARWCAQNLPGGGTQSVSMTLASLSRFVQAHIFTGLLPSADFADQMVITAISGQKARLECQEGMFTIGQTRKMESEVR